MSHWARVGIEQVIVWKTHSERVGVLMMWRLLFRVSVPTMCSVYINTDDHYRWVLLLHPLPRTESSDFCCLLHVKVHCPNFTCWKDRNSCRKSQSVWGLYRLFSYSFFEPPALSKGMKYRERKSWKKKQPAQPILRAKKSHTRISLKLVQWMPSFCSCPSLEL